MRTYFTAGTIAALVVFGFGPVVWGQQSQGGGSTSTSSGSTGTAPGGSEFGRIEFGRMSRMQDVQSGEFVGADIQDARDAMTATGAQRAGQTGQGGLSPFGSGRGFQQTRRPGSRTGYGSRRTTGQIRARLRVGFSVVRPAPAQLGSRLAQRLEKSSWIDVHSPIEVAFEQGTAILRGVVATEHDRVLAERATKLEPGVRQDENLLTLAPASESPSTR